MNHTAELRISPSAERAIHDLPSDVREKVKNALKEISTNGELGTALGLRGGRRLYKAGRFRILYHRENGSVLVDALSLDPFPAFSSSSRRSAL